MSLKLIKELNSKAEGLSSSEASTIRSRNGGELNVVAPPINCPAWVCCLLPCIKNIPKMRLFKTIQPEDAEVKRDGKWVCYDASSLVKGDLIRLTEGDLIPADCIVISLGNELNSNNEMAEELVVDVGKITGEARPRTVHLRENEEVPPVQMFYGGLVLTGSCIAIVNATGSDTLLHSLILQKCWPPLEDIGIPINYLDATKDKNSPSIATDEELAVSLLIHHNAS